jgi:hypothetical protein
MSKTTSQTLFLEAIIIIVDFEPFGDQFKGKTKSFVAKKNA